MEFYLGKDFAFTTLPSYQKQQTFYLKELYLDLEFFIQRDFNILQLTAAVVNDLVGEIQEGEDS